MPEPDTALDFSPVVFGREVIYNLFWPLSLPLGVCLEGVNGMRNRSLIPMFGKNAVAVLFFSLVPAIGTWLPVVCYGLGLCPSMGLVEVYTTFLVTLLHRLAVATKYAYLNQGELQTFREDFALMPPDVGNEMQLSGWSCQNRKTILLHAMKAAARVFSDSELHLRFRTEQQLPRELPLVQMARAAPPLVQSAVYPV